MPHNLSIFRFQFSPPSERHYNSALSIWLSVDPMSDKYPSMSPYTYCANNPVRLVDPNGETIYIDGDDETMAEEGFKDMQKGTNLTLYKGKDGIVYSYGDPISDVDYQLWDAIHDPRVDVHINCVSNNPYNELGGSFMKSEYFDHNKTAETINLVGIYQMRLTEIQHNAPAGSGIIHEATEGYAAGLLSIKNKIDISAPTKTEIKTQEGIGCDRYGNNLHIITSPSWQKVDPQEYSWYWKAHSTATAAPNEMNRSTRNFYKAANARTINRWTNEILLQHGK